MTPAAFRDFVLAMPLLPPAVRDALAQAGDRLKEVDRIGIAALLQEGMAEHLRILEDGVAPMEQLLKKGQKIARASQEEQERFGEQLPDFS